MDSIRVSEAPDPGSIPGEATEKVNLKGLAFLLSGIEKVQSSRLGSRKDGKEDQGAKEKKASLLFTS